MTIGIVHRRGIALLLVLIVLTSLAVISVGTLRSAHRLSLLRGEMIRQREVEGLLRDLRPWLVESAEDAAARTGFGTGWNEVLDARLDTVSLRVSGLDLSGRVRIDRLDSVAAEGGLPIDTSGITIIDLDGVDARPPLESCLPSSMVLWCLPDGGADDGAVLWLTTHGDGALNLRTAPPRLIRAAAKGIDHDLVEQFLHGRALSRAEDDRTGELGRLLGRLIRAQNQRLRGGGGERHVRFGSDSSALGFLIEMRHDRRVPVRWWIVVSRDGSDAAHRHHRWRIVEDRQITP